MQEEEPVINRICRRQGEYSPFQLIFTTAYSGFAARTFRVSAVDYLLKPINGPDLVAAVAKAAKRMYAGAANPTITNLLDNAKQSAGRQKIAVPSRMGYEFITVNEILYCKAGGAYSHLILHRKKLVLSKPLGEVEQLLPATLFERIHHSVLVNLHYVTGLKKSEGLSVVMNNGGELPVSKEKKKASLPDWACGREGL